MFSPSLLFSISFVLSNEEDNESLTEMESEILEQKFSEKNNGITTVIAQAEGMEEKMGVARGIGMGIEVLGVVMNVKAVQKKKRWCDTAVTECTQNYCA